MDHRFEFIEVRAHTRCVFVGQLVTGFVDGSAGLVDDLVRSVAQFDLGLAGLVGFCEFFCLCDLRLDFVFAERGLGFDLDGLLLAGAEVLGADVDDAVRVDVEGDLDLRHPTWGGGQANKVELAQRHVVLGELTFPLQDVNFHRRLVVGGGREGL